MCDEIGSNNGGSSEFKLKIPTYSLLYLFLQCKVGLMKQLVKNLDQASYAGQLRPSAETLRVSCILMSNSIFISQGHKE